MQTYGQMLNILEAEIKTAKETLERQMREAELQRVRLEKEIRRLQLGHMPEPDTQD